MAVFDVANKAITLKIVYYGCALGGKTTNLATLHSLTDPDNVHGLVSIATKDDRTLFFDLLPMDLGQIGGLTVRVKAYTVPGQVHYELTRRQVLAGADGVVLVVDSSPEVRQANTWALENLGFNLKANGLDFDKIPFVIQWNKRDLPNARPIEEMQAELNRRKVPAYESVATSGAGVVETFASILKASIRTTCAKSGRACIADNVLDETVDKALEQARSREPSLPDSPGPGGFEHRTDTDQYHEKWAERGRDRRILDQEALLTEAVQTGMELAERFDALHDVHVIGERRAEMIAALARVAGHAHDVDGAAIPSGLLANLLEAAGRSRGSVLLFQRGEGVMEEREVVPEGKDPLNAVVVPSVGSAAHRLCKGTRPRLVADIASEIFFETSPPEAAGLSSCFVAPLFCDGISFGALVAYAAVDESPLDPTECEFWAAASAVLALSLHWRGLRRKIARAGESSPGSSPGPARPMV